jgi:hypothetical protein
MTQQSYFQGRLLLEFQSPVSISYCYIKILHRPPYGNIGHYWDRGTARHPAILAGCMLLLAITAPGLADPGSVLNSGLAQQCFD